MAASVCPFFMHQGREVRSNLATRGRTVNKAKRNQTILMLKKTFANILSQKSWSFGTILILKVCFSSFNSHYRTILDPYGLMAMLGFLVFLFYIIYNYLNATGNAAAGSGRGLNLKSTKPRISSVGTNFLLLIPEILSSMEEKDFWRAIDRVT